MKQTLYLTTTVQKGNRLDISLPSLPVGQTIEVILIISETTPSQLSDGAPRPLKHRQAFLQIPIEERRRILTQQAETMQEYYQEDEPSKDWINFDNGEIHDYQSQTE